MGNIHQYKDRDYSQLEKIFDIKLKGIEDLIEEKLKGICVLVKKHDETLYSKTGNGGLQKDSNDIKNSILLFKWFVGISGGLVVAKEFIKKVIGLG